MLSVITIGTKEIKKRFTEINKLVREKGKTVIITNRGIPSTAIISVDLLRELIGDEAFKEVLFESFIQKELENRTEKLLEKREKLVSFEKIKKELNW